VLEQRVEGVGQNFIGTIADKYVAGRHAVVIRHSLLQAVTIRVRVQTQVVVQLALHGRQRFGRRAIRVFIGVELDQLGHLRLFTRHIRHQVFNEGAPEFAHLPFSPHKHWDWRATHASPG
jgi:hypothetical protein